MFNGDGAGAVPSAALGKVDQELERDLAEPRRADRFTQSLQRMLFAPANAPLQFLQVGEVKLYQTGERLAIVG